jgi:hypothetical protein
MFSCTTAHKLPSWCLLKCSAVRCFKLYCISTYTFSHVVRSDLSNVRYCHKAQRHLFLALRNTTNCSSGMEFIYRQSHSESRSFNFTLLAASAVSQFHSDKEQADVTMVTDTLCKLKTNLSKVTANIDLCKIFFKNTEFYSKLITVQLIPCFK